MSSKRLGFRMFGYGFLLLSLCYLLSAPAVDAASVTLRWDASTSSPDGYKLFARKSNQAYNYSQPNWQGSAVTCTLNNLTAATDYYFVVRAYDGSLESANSTEVHYVAPGSSSDTVSTSGSGSSSSGDTSAPLWNGATTGIGLAKNNGTGGSVTIEFDTAKDAVNGTNLKYNVYYAPSSSWNNTNWSANKVVANASVNSGSTFAHAVTLTGLSNNVSYTFGVRAEDQSGNEDKNTGKLTATPTVSQTKSTYNLMLSYSTNRSGAVYLDDAGVEGKIYVFVSPITNVKQVKFFIDNKLQQTESVAPYDLAGTATSGASPFDTGKLSDGYHTFSAQITKTNGSNETISADVYVNVASGGGQSPVTNVTIDNSSTYTQWVSALANRSKATELDGANLDGNVYVFVEPITDVKQVKFFIDGTLRQSESLAPYDLAGTADSGVAAPFNTGTLSQGTHKFSAQVIKTSGGSETLSADVYVGTASGSSSSTTTNTSSGSSSAVSQWVSTSSNRSSAKALNGASLTNKVYVFVKATADIKSVQFLIDGALRQTESLAPYDLAGTNGSGLAYPFDTHTLSNGSHKFNARITKTNGSSETISATVSVKN